MSSFIPLEDYFIMKFFKHSRIQRDFKAEIQKTDSQKNVIWNDDPLIMCETNAERNVDYPTFLK